MFESRWVPVESVVAPESNNARRRGSGHVVVEKIDDNAYRLVDGHSAYQRAIASGVAQIGCLVRMPSENLEDRLAEHITVGGLTPMEEARLLLDVMNTYGYSQRAMFHRYGIRQAHISKRLALLRLDPERRRRLEEGLLTVEQALEEARSCPGGQRGQ